MFIREIDGDLYTRKALAESRDAYREYCSIRVEPLPGKRARVTMSVKIEHSSNTRQIILEFWNYFLDCSTRALLEEV